MKGVSSRILRDRLTARIARLERTLSDLLKSARNVGQETTRVREDKITVILAA